jgi:Domain of unknown function (DUF4159)/Aerotolerance regulator N-terminal
MISTLSFLTPLALWGALALPIIWWLLRAIPPRPKTQIFPPLRLLLKLHSKEETPTKTPWWVLLLRLALSALLIIAVAHPLLRKGTTAIQKSGPILLIVDDGWAAAKSWPKRQDVLQQFIETAREQQRAIILATTTPKPGTSDLKSMPASDASNALRLITPQALSTDRLAVLNMLKKQNIKAETVIWLSDGFESTSATEFAKGLTQLYGENLQVFSLGQTSTPLGLARPKIEGGDIVVTALKMPSSPSSATVQAIAGDGRILAEVTAEFASSNTATAKLSMPVELRNEIQTLSIKSEASAAARQLLDDRWRRKTIAIQTGVTQEAAQPLLSPLHYVTNALSPFAELREPQNTSELKIELEQGLSMLVLADIGKMPQDSHDAILPWIEKGGVLLRFAGQRMAISTDDLIPEQLRAGDRNLGSALSWETPQTLQAFPQNSPFSGIAIDPRIQISRQVLAEPNANLTDNSWANLSDGTPLVTAKRQGKGLIILFHVTANADWSNLPLSGTFVDMLQHIVDVAPAAGGNKTAPENKIETNTFAPRLLLSGTGELAPPTADITLVSTADFDITKASAKTLPGLYVKGGQERALNLDLQPSDFEPIKSIPLQQVKPPETKSLAPVLFALSAALFLIDCIAALFLGGAFKRRAIQLSVLLFIGLFFAPMPQSKADDAADMAAALQTHLAFVKTGDAEIDATSLSGLKGLGQILAERTSAVLGEPAAINIETDDLVFYPLLYWPVTEKDQSPSEGTLQRLDSYMKNGGTVFFDLRDNGGDFSTNSGTGEALKRILSKLDIPPLEPVPEGHVLTRSFYILNNFPGRYEGGPLWVETQSSDAATNSSDGVSGVIIGSNDYAAAWAQDDNGQPLNAMIPGSDRQREMAFRVGVNVVMYALTGNYKTDQVHIPALLERLGQ